MEKFLAYEEDISRWILAAFEFKETEKFDFWWDLHWKWKEYVEKMWKI